MFRLRSALSEISSFVFFFGSLSGDINIEQGGCFFLMLRLRSALSEISSFVLFRKLELGHQH